MLLAVDVGNTHTVVGLYDLESGEGGADSGLVGHWRLATVPDRTEDELAVLLQGILDFGGWNWINDITGVAISSGVPRITSSLRHMVERYIQVDPVVLGPGTKTGMPVLYDSPKEVGADRIANAVGAFDLYGGPTIVVDFGTGTTLDAISESGEYLGGAISPGIEISLEALFDRAAALREIELIKPRTVIGRSTVESLQSGALYGYSAQVDGLCARFEEEMGESTVLATGGLCHVIAPYSREIEHIEPWLTLHGLRLIWRKNVDS
jgi:type III pantothenate kinase